jgi:hypothetical protein
MLGEDQSIKKRLKLVKIVSTEDLATIIWNNWKTKGVMLSHKTLFLTS